MEREEGVPQYRNRDEKTPHIPEEVIVEEILPRLPGKSLLRFRCVSKYWCSLIGSKRFIKQHLKHSMFAQHLLFYSDSEQEFKECSLPSLFDKSGPVTSLTCNTANLVIAFENNIYDWGCCNGLVCILEYGYIFILWNPTTKKVQVLPLFFDEIELENGNIGTYGFGFDELDDDYKVYARVNQVDVNNAPIRCIGMIYSLKSNSWKVIEERDAFSDNELDMGEYLSGKLHWCRGKGIVSFDLNSHVYRVVELPSYTTGDLDSVGVVGGYLSVHFRDVNGGTDVWLMKEYGVKESFIKVATIPRHPDFYGIPTALAIGPNGEVLLTYPFTLVIYDPKSDVFRHPLIAGIDVFRHPLITGIDDDWYIFCVYGESLTSIDPDTEQER